MTHTELAQETLDYYKDNPRGLNNLGQCVYLTENKNKCAVGRCLDEESPHYKEIIEKYNWGMPANKLIEKLDIIIFKKEYLNINPQFWGVLQIFHDTYYYWNNDGSLSWFGQKEYESILKLAKIYDDRQKGKK